jgi:DNA (cytosine-5)-methyltransferase 1
LSLHLTFHVVSLFAGIGGFDLGFERAGFKTVAVVERDEKCRKLLAAKWPDAVALDDVCTAGAHNLPACDVVTFGFPCQDLSVAGKRAGLAGGRSGLFYEATRIIDEIKPAYCLFENVPGLLSSDKGRDFARVLMEMDRIGYSGAWRVLDAQWLGVAQRRRRVFGLFSRLDSGAERCAEILSIRESLRGHPAPSREAGKVAPALAASGVEAVRTGNERNEVDFCIEQATPWDTQRSRIMDVNGTAPTLPSGSENSGNIIPAVAIEIAGTLDGKCCAANRGSQANECDFIVPETFRMTAFGEYADDGTASAMKARDFKAAIDLAIHPVGTDCYNGAITGDVAATMGTPGSSVNASGPTAMINMAVRRLLPVECERLQGFPDGWTEGFADSSRYKMLGNAVCVNVSEWIAKRMAKFENQTGETK